MKPGEVVNVVTMMLEDDGDPEAIAQALESGGDLTEGILQTVVTLEAGGIAGELVGELTDSLFGLIEGLVANSADGEVLSFAITQYTYDEIVLLTHAAQLGLTQDELSDLELPSLQAAPSRQVPFQGNSFSVSERVILPELPSWGRHVETRRYTTTGNSDPFPQDYRGESRYELELSITHQRE